MSGNTPYIDPETGKPVKKTKALTTHLPQELYEAVKRQADEQGRSLAEIIRSWLTLWTAGEVFTPPKVPGAEERSQRSDKGKKRKKYKPRGTALFPTDDNDEKQNASDWCRGVYLLAGDFVVGGVVTVRYHSYCISELSHQHKSTQIGLRNPKATNLHLPSGSR